MENLHSAGRAPRVSSTPMKYVDSRVHDGQHQALALLHAPRRTQDRGQPVERGVEVGVQHDLPGGGQTVDVAGAGGALGVEVEGRLGAGEVTEGSGPARVQRRLGPECLQACRAVGEGPVEVERVGDVELGLEPHRAGEVHLMVVDGRVTRIDEQVAVLQILDRVDVGEVIPLDRLGDEAVKLR